jgi:hypothetical protein
MSRDLESEEGWVIEESISTIQPKTVRKLRKDLIMDVLEERDDESKEYMIVEVKYDSRADER